MVAKLSPTAQRFISLHIRRHITVYRMPRDQAIAVAYAEAREKGYGVPPALGRTDKRESDFAFKRALALKGKEKEKFLRFGEARMKKERLLRRGGERMPRKRRRGRKARRARRSGGKVYKAKSAAHKAAKGHWGSNIQFIRKVKGGYRLYRYPK